MRIGSSIRVLCCPLAIAALLLLVAPASGQAKEAWRFSLTGRGYGHGIGMSQYGACGCAREGWSYRQILQHYYTGIDFGDVPNSDVRVLLTSGQSSVAITCAGTFTATVGSSTVSLAGGSTATVTWTGAAFRLLAGDVLRTSTSPIAFSPTGSSRLVMSNSNLNTWAGTENTPYRGSLTVARLSSALCVVNTLPIESYLRGVVPREMPSSWPAEALKAQAVAARTYAVRALSSSGLFDLYCDTRSQAYGGARGETAATDAAVSDTCGVTATYAGRPIAAFYFSTSGGHTENIENVWPAAAQPYLKGVPDPYDTPSPYHIWPDNPLVRSGSVLSAALGSFAPAGDLQALIVVQRGVSRRVVRALALSPTGATAVHGTTLRTCLGLRDSWLDIRSLSISPSEGASVAGGQSVVLTARTYPALAAGKTATLHFKRDGVWRTTTVPATAIVKSVRKVRADGVTYSATSSTLTMAVTPLATTQYYFSYGTARSPGTTVRVTTPTSTAPTTSSSPGT